MTLQRGFIKAMAFGDRTDFVFVRHGTHILACAASLRSIDGDRKNRSVARAGVPAPKSPDLQGHGTFERTIQTQGFRREEAQRGPERYPPAPKENRMPRSKA